MSPRRPSPAPFQQPDGRPLLATVTKAAEWLPATSTEITATIQRAGLQVAAIDARGAQTGTVASGDHRRRRPPPEPLNAAFDIRD